MKQIPLTQGKFALIDDRDFERVSQFKWCAIKERNSSQNTFYAVRNVRIDGKRTKLLMHRFILDLTNPKVHIDHWDGDGLNNRRLNLRVCTQRRNHANERKHKGACSSQYKGVSWDKTTNKWRACIHSNGRQKNLGSFTDEKTAAKAYDDAAIGFWGEFARLNFPKVKVNLMRNPVELDRAQEKMRRRHGAAIKASPVPAYDSAEQVEQEQHFTPAEIAKQWGLSVYTVRRLFADVPGVLKIGQKGKHVSLRIPGRLLKAYHTKLSACRVEYQDRDRRDRRGPRANVKIQF